MPTPKAWAMEEPAWPKKRREAFNSGIHPDKQMGVADSVHQDAQAIR